MGTQTVRTGGILLLGSAVVYFACEAIAAAAWHHPPYSYAHNYISDLGVPGPSSVLMGRVIDSPLAVVMNAGFVAQGVLSMVAALLLAPLVPSGGRRVAVIGLSALHAAGMVMIAVVHGSVYSIAHGLFVYHSVGANLAIFSANVLSIVIGALHRPLRAPRWFAVVSVTLGVLGFVSLGLLALRTSVPDGIFERGAVYSIFAWEVFAGSVLSGRPPGARVRTGRENAAPDADRGVGVAQP